MELKREVGFSVDSGLGIITVDRPAKRNTLTPGLIDAIDSSLDEAFTRSDIRVVVIRALGDTFCAGMDLGELAAGDSGDGESGRPALLRVAIDAYAALLRRISTGPKPVVAVVTGDLLAGGVGLAGACDLVLALESVRVQLGETVFGLIPATIMPFLVGRRITAGVFRRLALTAVAIDSKAALEAGLFDSTHPDRESLERAVRATMKQLFRVSPVAAARLKSLLAASIDSPVPPYDYSRRTLFSLASSPDTLEAVRAMQEGETPAWFQSFKPTNPIVPKEEPHGTT